VSHELLGYDRPIFQPILVDENNPPFSINIQGLPQGTEQLVPWVTAMLINEAVSKLPQNRARLFYFNLVSNNNYQNPVFTEIVKLTIGAIYIDTHKGLYRGYDYAARELVSKVTTLYVSSLFFQYPELKSMVPPQVVNASYQNIQTFNNLKEEVAAMFNRVNNMPGVPVDHMGRPLVGMPNNPMATHPNMGPGMYPNNQMQPSGFMPGMYPNQVPVQQFSGNPNMGFGNQGVDIRQQQFFDNSQQNSRFNRPNVQQPQQPAPQEIYQQPVKEPESLTCILTIIGGSEEEFAKTTVNFLSNNISMNNAERQELHKHSIKSLELEHAKNDSDIFGVKKYVYPSCLMETSLDNAIIDGRIKQFELQNDETEDNVFRCFAIIGNPVFSTSEMDSYIEVIRNCQDFKSLTDKLKAIGSAASLQKDKKYANRILSFLNTIENTFTYFVNDFLTNRIAVTTKIESFCEDAPQLFEYLESKYGYNACEAFKKFESEAINSLLEYIDGELKDSLIDELVLPEKLKLEIIPVNHSLTYTFLNNKELGFVTNNKLNIIDPVVSPSLYKIATSLEKHKQEMQFTTMVDLLITADNYRYQIYRNYSLESSNTYYIKKA
jgi:hypothetical protein